MQIRRNPQPVHGLPVQPLLLHCTIVVFCPACGEAVATNDRQILCNEASSYVRMMWQRLHDNKLEQESFTVDVESALRDEESPGCVQRKCFTSIECCWKIGCYDWKKYPRYHCQKITIAIQKLLHPGRCREEKELGHPQLKNNPLQNAQD